MNVEIITMPVEEAKAAYREYREAVRNNPNPEDQAVMLGYRALAQGKAVIDVAQAIRGAGLNEQNLPRVAIARASWEWVVFSSKGQGAGEFLRSPRGCHYGPWPAVLLPNGTFPQGASRAPWRARALVPTIPPKLRPARLEDYHILWEAEWQRAPRDPMLLKYLSGNLYAVLAVWDLTPLEQAVLGSRIAR